MALLFLDSFDHYASPQDVTRKWTMGMTAIGAGRNGNGGSSANFVARTTLPGTWAEMAAGTAYRTAAFTNFPLILYDYQIGNLWGLALGHDGAGRLYLRTQANIGAPSAFVMNLNQWYYLELWGRITARKSVV